MNCLRKHLSSLKGGRLAAAAHPARVVSLIISDVPGDDPSIVASGPTAPDPTTRQDALAIVEKRKLKLPGAVLRFLESPEAETPKPGDARLANVENRMIATPAQSLAAAARLAEQAGYSVLDLGDRVEGEAREVARDHAEIALAIAAGRHATRAPAVVLSGGETTVTMRGQGRGGRNAEYALALALALDGQTRASGRWPATPTASTGRRTMPARWWRPTRWRGPARPASTPRPAGRQRCLRLLRRARRPRRHRADADQRQRLPRHPDRAGIEKGAADTQAAPAIAEPGDCYFTLRYAVLTAACPGPSGRRPGQTRCRPRSRRARTRRHRRTRCPAGRPPAASAGPRPR
jgi:hypothetical protein